MIAILDIETGMLDGIERALSALGENVVRASAPAELDRVDAIILPHCRSFRRALRQMRDHRLAAAIHAAADAGAGILGIGAGLHMLLDVSHEDGQHTGLGLIHGRVACFDFGRHPAARHFSSPHQGWNRLSWRGEPPLKRGLTADDYYYFDHSHHAEPVHPGATLATCMHGVEFPAVVARQHVVGVQFLPERSEAAGATFLRNFLDVTGGQRRSGADRAA